MVFSSVGGQVGWQVRVAGSVGVDGRVREVGKRWAHSPTRGDSHAHSRVRKPISHDRDPYGYPDGALARRSCPSGVWPQRGICPGGRSTDKGMVRRARTLPHQGPLRGEMCIRDRPLPARWCLITERRLSRSMLAQGWICEYATG